MSAVQGFATGQTRSSTPPAKKPTQNVAFVALPKPLEWLAEVAEFASVRMFDSWTAFSRAEPAYDVVHGFSTSRADLMVGTARAPMGLVDVKVCAVDEIRAGLKLMVRRELRHKGWKGQGAKTWSS